MTIKEVEDSLQIPRATVRYYEKEGLLLPQREENGYREYSESDVERLKKIIVLRKIGMTVTDIGDIFDGVKPMQEVLDLNAQRLQTQMAEITGALRLCTKMQEDSIDINVMNAEEYLNVIDEEESKGNTFIDIAKDIADIEKGVVLRHVSSLDADGNPYSSPVQMIRNGIIIGAGYGCIKCLIEREWSLSNFVGGIYLLIATILVEAVLGLFLYWVGRKVPWIAKNRSVSMLITTAILFVIVLVLALMLQ